MKKEKVFIVLCHKHVLKKGTRNEWEVSETVEFVNQLRNRHLTTSSAIGDYINRKMQSGERVGMSDYTKFENYLYSKYKKEMDELDTAYGNERALGKISEPELITDSFGNLRPATVFD